MVKVRGGEEREDDDDELRHQPPRDGIGGRIKERLSSARRRDETRAPR
jgi:hypothetical protein